MTDGRSLLEEAGWFEQRSTDPIQAIEGLNAAGFHVYPWMNKVVGEFGGLTIRFVDDDGYADEIVLSAEVAASLWFPDRMESYERRTGEELLPIGHARTGHALLLVGKSGSWYASFDDLLWMVADNPFDAVDRLIEGTSFEVEY